ncbi:MAG: hypothetical protein H7178_11800, partial [Chitinophagaceae bacterium]|nr:hypothetical protein [Chitinophagaceae bacterium]
MKFLKLIILFFFTYATATYAQGLNFININADMGLPSNECYRLAQDARGYIWISTEAGLARYSSKEFVLFNTSKGMPSNNVYALDADKTGRLWFATGNWDVGYILNDSVHVLKGSFFNETIKSGDVIYKMKYDEQQKSLYVSSHHQTIKIVEENNKFYITALDTSNIPRDYLFVRNNAFTYLGNLWNYKRIPQLDRFLRFPVTLNLNPKDSMVLPIGLQSTFFTEAFTAFLNDREYVVGILDKLVVLNIYNEISSILKLPSQIQCVFSDKKNNLWVSCKKDGVYIFEIGNLAKKPIHLLSGLCISAIIEDIEGGIWASSLEKGVFFCPNKMVNITHPPLNNANGIAFIKVINNHLFLNNETIPLSRVNGDTITIQQLGKEKTFTVTDIVPTKGGYFLTTSLGIYEIDSTLKKNNQLLLPSRVYGGAAGLFSNDLGEDFAYNNASIYNIKNHKLKFCFSNLPRIKHAIFLKNKGIVLVSTLGLYLVKLDAFNNPSYQSVPSAIKTKAAQTAHDVNKIYQDNLGNFWLPANNDTLNILDENFNLKKAICLIEKNISCRNVLQIAPTVFFVCTNKGLLQVIFKDTTFSNYSLRYFDNSNGLASTDTYNVVQINNKFYVSTSKGLCYFNSPD